MDAFATLRLVAGASFLTAAAASDVRTRRVRDPLWITMGTAGLLLLAAEIALSYWYWDDWLLLLSAALLFYAVFYGKPILGEDGIRLRPFRILWLGIAALAFVLALFLPNPFATAFLPAGAVVLPDAELATMPVLLVVYQGFYRAGILRGGADAKGLLALTLLVPLYPDASPFPLLVASPAATDAMHVVFPFSLVVLADAAVLALAVPLMYVIVNASRGNIDTPMWRGIRVPINRIPRHARLLERVDPHGERYVVLFPSRERDDTEELAKLEAAGANRVWVEIWIPLILFLYLGFLVAFFVGNLILGVLTALLPPP